MSVLLMAIRRAHLSKDLTALVDLERLKSEKRSFDKRMDEMARVNTRLHGENQKLKSELVKRAVLDEDGNIKYRRPSVKELKLAVARKYGFTPIDLESQRRQAPLTRARHILFYLAKKHLTMSYPQIGLNVGGRDHTTVLHGVKKIALLAELDPDLAAEITEIENNLHITENGIPILEEGTQ